MTTHLLVTLSAHGFGHIGQTAPVLDALRLRVPGLRVTVRSAAPTYKILERFGADVQCQTAILDIGMVQRNALEISVHATSAAYEAMHDSWSARIEAEAECLSVVDPDLILANIPYLSLAAAQRAGIPAVAMGSLSWADIYRHYFEGRRDEADWVLGDMLLAYNSALRFLQPEPRMPMRGLSNGLPIGPVAQLGNARRGMVLARTTANPDDRLVMVSLGGMDVRLPVESWSSLDRVHLIVPAAWGFRGRHVTAFEDLEMPFADVMASCDALVAKPGYCSFVEAACLGIPVLYLDRPDWPEVPYVVEWLERHGRCQRFPQEMIEGGQLQPLLETLWGHAITPISPTGVDQAADYLAGLLE